MRCKTLVAIAALVFANAAVVHAQNRNDTDKFRVSGRVVDKTTGAPVQTAIVRFEDLRRAVVADSLGRFVLEKLPPGTHYLEIARLGYAPTMELVRVVGDNDSLLIAWSVSPRATHISDRLFSWRLLG